MSGAAKLARVIVFSAMMGLALLLGWSLGATTGWGSASAWFYMTVGYGIAMSELGSDQ